MNGLTFEIKLKFIPGLREVVLDEITRDPSFVVTKEEDDCIYLRFVQDFTHVTKLRSILRAYVVIQDRRYMPPYIANHKSVLGTLLTKVVKNERKTFKSFKINCAGSNSHEIRSLAGYIEQTYKLAERDEADLKLHIIKTNKTWEIGAEMTERPLFLRSYKARNMMGAMNPTIAYAVNALCHLENADTYLNVFSGSATLLIEAGHCYPDLKKLVGFDNDKDNFSLAIQNIKEAKLLGKIRLKEADIYDEPQLGGFDVITSDLPFGMLISKQENLQNLYKQFVAYCQKTLNDQGTLAVYTNEHKIFKRLILNSKFTIVKTLELKIDTSANAYIYPKIFVCRKR